MTYPGPTPAVYVDGELTEIAEPTPGLRWFKPDGCGDPTRLRLQQYWAVKVFKDGECNGLSGEWRDVPTVIEDLSNA